MELKVNQDPVFGEDFALADSRPGFVEIVPRKNPRYHLSEEAITALNSGHQISPAKRVKLQQIIRFKSTRGETVGVERTHI